MEMQALQQWLNFCFDCYLYLDRDGQRLCCSPDLATDSELADEPIFPELSWQQLCAMSEPVSSYTELCQAQAHRLALSSGWQSLLGEQSLVRLVMLEHLKPDCSGLLIQFIRQPQLESDSVQLQVMQQQLMQADKMAAIGQLAAGVAHEINNPIGYVSSNLQTLADYCQQLIRLIEQLAESLPEEQVQPVLHQHDFDFVRDDFQTLLEESDEGIQRVIEIIRALKDFSHTDEGNFVLADIHHGITTTLSIVNNEIKYKASVELDFAALPEVECIPSQLNQVLLNLLVNACHAIERDGIIVIRTRQQADWVCIEVQDNGKGIAAEHLNRLFEPFFTTKPVGQGTGLGLALSHSIISKHHGRIEVDSVPAEGSCFRLWLPLRQPDSEQQAAD